MLSRKAIGSQQIIIIILGSNQKQDQPKTF